MYTCIHIRIYIYIYIYNMYVGMYVVVALDKNDNDNNIVHRLDIHKDLGSLVRFYSIKRRFDRR